MGKPKKFVLHPGVVGSIHDKDWHYVGVGALCNLYQISLKDCLVVRENDPKGVLAGLGPEYIHLYPLAEGNYLEVKDAKVAALKERAITSENPNELHTGGE